MRNAIPSLDRQLLVTATGGSIVGVPGTGPTFPRPRPQPIPLPNPPWEPRPLPNPSPFPFPGPIAAK